MGLGSSKATSGPLANVDQTLVAQIPEHVKTHLQTIFEEQAKYVNELQSKCNQIKVDSEQRSFEIERELSVNSGKLDEAGQLIQSLKAQNADLESKYTDTSVKYRTLQDEYFNKEKYWINEEISLRKKTSALEAEVHDLAYLLDKKKAELERLQGEWGQMTEKLNESNKTRIEALAKVEEAMSEAATAQQREGRIRNEKEHIQQQRDWLDAEVRRKSDEVLSLTKDKSTELLHLQAQLTAKTEELEILERSSTAQKETNAELSQKIEEYLTELKESRDELLDMDERYRTEVQALNNLVNIYKESNEKNQERIKELISAVDELQKIVKEAHEANTELKQKCSEDETTYLAELNIRDEKLQTLFKELTDANELLEIARKKGLAPLSDSQVAELSPSAAKVSALLQSGMTLTQIYSEYVTATDELQQEREENEKLNKYIDQIMQEIEEKAPVLKKQKEEYVVAMNSVAKLTGQLEEAMQECETSVRAASDNARRNGELKRDNDRLQHRTKDLSLQVRFLLKELEEARGRKVHDYDPDLDTSNTEVTSSSQVISQRLVTFRSIEELQEQNQRLLEVVRDLSEQKEEQDSSQQGAGDLQDELEKACSELEEMRAARNRQVEMVEAIMQQRDMYRSMLASHSPATQVPVPALTSTPAPSLSAQMLSASPQFTPTKPPVQSVMETSAELGGGESMKLVEDTQNSLKQLQEDFAAYRRDKTENLKVLETQLEQFREEKSSMMLQNAKLSSQLEFTAERFKAVKANSAAYKKEIEAMREKNQALTTSIVRHEQTLASLTEELRVCRENLTRAEVQSKSQRAQMDILINSEARTSQEHETMMRQNSSSDLLLTNLQLIQVSLERSQFDTKVKFEDRIASLEKENLVLRRQVEGSDLNTRQLISTLEKQLSVSKDECLHSKNSLDVLERQLSFSQDDNKRLSEQVSSLTTRLSVAESQTSKSDTDVSSREEVTKLKEEVSYLHSQVAHEQSQVKSLEEQLSSSNEHTEQYKTIASSVENSLQQLNQTTKEYREKSEAQVEELQTVISELRETVNRLESENSALQAEQTRLDKSSTDSGEELRAQLGRIQRELEEALRDCEEARSNERAAREDLAQQATVAQEAQDKYQRELVLHAADVQALSTLQAEVDGHNAKMEEIVADAKTAKDALSAAQEAWAEQEKVLREDGKKVHKRLEEMQIQNTHLHKELEAMSDQMVALQKSMEHEDSHTRQLAATMAQETATVGSQRSADQMLEVIKFLRKEKELAEAKFDVVQSESSRVKQQLEHVTRLQQEVSRALEEERQKTQIRAETAAGHAELLRKVENLNLLQDSNRLLREEKDRMLAHLRQHEAKTRELEDAMEPLHAEKRDLISQRDTLQGDIQVLRSEVEVWKTRTNQLVEECNKIDPLELQRTKEERDELSQQVQQRTAELNKKTTELTTLNAQMTATKQKLTASLEKANTATTELESSQTKMKTMEVDVENKEKTIGQLRRVGRKWKTQAEDTQKELDELKVKVEQQQGAQSSINSLQEQLKSSEDQIKVLQEKTKVLEEQLRVKIEKAKKTEEDVKRLTEEVGAAETAKTEMMRTKNEAIRGRTEVTNELKMNREKQKEVEEEAGRLRADVTRLTEQETKLTAEKEDLEKKYKHSLTMLQTAKVKIATLKNQQSQQGEGSSVAADQDTRVSQLEQELTEARQSKTSAVEELTSLRRDHTEMQQRLQLLQRQLENQQKQPAPTTPRSVPPSVSTTESTPRTANIRPTPVVAQAPRVVQPVRSTPAMASIRPMTTGAVSTPTATVMPTSLTNLDSEMVVSSISVLPTMASGRPTQQVQPVSPHMDTTTQEPPTDVTSTDPSSAPAQVPPVSVPVLPTPASTIQDTFTTPTDTTMPAASMPEPVSVPQTTAPAVSVPQSTVAATSLPQSTVAPTNVPQTTAPAASVPQTSAPTASVPQLPAQTASVPQTSAPPTTDLPEDQVTTQVPSTTVESADQVEPPADTPVDTPVTPADEDTLTTSAPKRAREETSSSQEDTEGESDVPTKKTRLLDSDMDNFEQQTSRQVLELVEPEEEDIDSVEEEAVEEAPSVTMATVEVGDYAQEELPDLDEDEEEEEAEIVIVDDDDDDDDDNDVQEEYPADYERYEYMEDDDDEDEDEQEEEEDYVQEEDIDDDVDEEEEEDDDDDDDIVVVDEEEMSVGQPDLANQQTPDPASSTATSVTPQPGAASSATVTARPVFSRASSQVSNRNQLTPFVLAAEGVFETGEEGIVPSTPTLFVPRRTDGFAEAVSSPGVQSGFLFGGNTDTATDFGQLASQAAGMDDSRIDLSQFDEQARSRSGTPAPQTPPVPPTIAVVSASPPHPTQEDSQPATAQPTSQEESGDAESSERGAVSTETPTTSSTSQPAAESQPSAASDKDTDKRKIEPIVWGESSSRGSAPARAPPASVSSASQGAPIPTFSQQQQWQPQGGPQQQPRRFRPAQAFRSRGTPQRGPFRSAAAIRGATPRSNTMAPQRGGPQRGGPQRGGPRGGRGGYRQNRPQF